ncbi:MAG: hypothetical protein ACREEM_09595 [Blastocatellia bacterium]
MNVEGGKDLMSSDAARKRRAGERRAGWEAIPNRLEFMSPRRIDRISFARRG